MSAMDWVTCKIAIAGDITQVVYRSKFSPVSVPELEVIRRLHGEASVNDVRWCGTSETTNVEEKGRLLSIYKEADVAAVYPGRSPQMEMLAEERPADAKASIEEDEDPTVPPPKRKKSTHEKVREKHTSAVQTPDIAIPD